MSLKFSREHQWLDASVADAAVVGISIYAQETLGDVVFVDLPKIGARFLRGEVAAAVESVKAAADVFSPVDGEVVAVNEKLRDDPGLVNTAPEGDGWFFKLRISTPAQLNDLLDGDAYRAFVQEQ